jgi:hypothetical protein
MDTHQRFCLDRLCATRTWMVQPHEDIPELWIVAESCDGPTWSIAAPEPLCPHCGATLSTAVDIRERLEGRVPPLTRIN